MIYNLSSNDEQLRNDNSSVITPGFFGKLIIKTNSVASHSYSFIISGVSYTSECTPCEAGFYNDEEAQGR